VIKSHKYIQSVMSIKVKLKNMDLWIFDYEEDPDQIAQILQLSFESDFFYDTDAFYKELECAKRETRPQKRRTRRQGHFFASDDLAVNA